MSERRGARHRGPIACTFTVALLGAGLVTGAITGGSAGAAAQPAVVTAPAPRNLPVRIFGAPKNDGVFGVRTSLHGKPVVWETTYHPMPTAMGTSYGATVIAAVAVLEQTSLKAGLFSGPLIPGGTGWFNGTAVNAWARLWLVGAFNGGFLFKHLPNSGYYSEGRMMKPLGAGQATLGIKKTTGLMVLGKFGTTIKNDGSWKALFQNLPPMVEGGKVAVRNYPGTWWGADFTTDVSNRSAICTRTDGRLMYVYVGTVTPMAMAQSMVNVGCQFGMELDINGTWPQFATYTGFMTSTRHGVVLDPRMLAGVASRAQRYLTYSDKSFVAFFDPAMPSALVH